VIGLLAFLYHVVASSSSFHLRNIEVRGNYRVGTSEVERVARERVSGTLFGASLGKLQDDLQKFTWIKSAQVTRLLPDTLRIQIEERKPLVLARVQPKGLVWIDDEAVILGEYDNTLDKDVPPLVFGFSSVGDEAAKDENHDRVELYKRLMWALDGGSEKYSGSVEEIDLSNLKDVRLQLNSKSARGPVEVELGEKDFRARLSLALDVLNALRRRDGATLKNYQILDENILNNPDRINFISVVHPTQVAIRISKAPDVQNREPKSRTQTDKVARADVED
jgi:cell division protein FtsQ